MALQEIDGFSMDKIIAAIVGGVAVLALSIPVVAFNGDGARNGTPQVITAKKRCKSGYVYNPKTGKCYRRGSH